MSAPGLRPRLGEALGAIGAWRWWRGEIAALLPQGLRDALDGSVAVIAIDFADELVTLRRFDDGKATEIARLPRAGLDAAALRAALSPYVSRPPLLREVFALRLPDALALGRNLTLPLAARRDLESLLDIELDRASPLDRSEVCFDYRIVHTDRATKQIEVAWRIARRKSFASALALCREAGIPLAIIAFTGDEAPADGGTFPVDVSAARLLRARRWLVRGLLILILALLAAIAVESYVRNQAAADAFAAHVDQTRVAALESLRLDHEIAAARARMALLTRERNKTPTVRMLAEVTRVLPPGSWLTDFAYRDGQVRIRGFSNQASALIAIFDASPLFTAAEFGAPLVQAQGRDLEQFDLTVKLRGGAP